MTNEMFQVEFSSKNNCNCDTSFILENILSQAEQEKPRILQNCKFCLWRGE